VVALRRAAVPLALGTDGPASSDDLDLWSHARLAGRLARLASGIHPDATTHTLRHSYATHLLEEGISLRQISSYLGHESLDTTAIYVHLTAISEARTQVALAALYQPRQA